MSKTAFAVAIPANNHPFKALVDSTLNMSELVFDFMYGTPERARFTYAFAIGLSLLGLGMDHAQTMASLRDCPVTSL